MYVLYSSVLRLGEEGVYVNSWPTRCGRGRKGKKGEF